MLGGNDTPEGRKKVLGTVPLGRVCLPEDVANMVCYLASDEANYITGAGRFFFSLTRFITLMCYFSIRRGWGKRSFVKELLTSVGASSLSLSDISIGREGQKKRLLSSVKIPMESQ